MDHSSGPRKNPGQGAWAEGRVLGHLARKRRDWQSSPLPPCASWVWAETQGLWVFVAQRRRVRTREAALVSEGSSRLVPGRLLEPVGRSPACTTGSSGPTQHWMVVTVVCGSPIRWPVLGLRLHPTDTVTFCLGSQFKALHRGISAPSWWLARCAARRLWVSGAVPCTWGWLGDVHVPGRGWTLQAAVWPHTPARLGRLGSFPMPLEFKLCALGYRVGVLRLL